MISVAEQDLRLGTEVMHRLDRLARFSEEEGALTRLYLTPEHGAAALQVRQWMEAAGMAVHVDAAGTVVGRYDGTGDCRPALLIGSHIDTVRNAGKYDGSLGVVAAIQAVAELRRRGRRLPFPVEVLAFGDEEGVRFPVTLLGSRTVAGTVDPAMLDARDDDGVTVREALLAFGCAPEGIPATARRRDEVLGYVELHIEQGPVLERADLPVGIVTAINGASRFLVEVAGEAGHAGTVPMALRRDALAAAAEMVLAIERRAAAVPDLVGTVGKLEVPGGATNVIPGAVRFTIDLRSPDDGQRASAVADMLAEIEAVASRRGVRATVRRTYEETARKCAPWLMERLEGAVAANGIEPLRLSSGAGHDASALAGLTDIAMLFVRCAGGISHNPAEAIAEADADTAVRVLLTFLESLEARRTID